MCFVFLASHLRFIFVWWQRQGKFAELLSQRSVSCQLQAELLGAAFGRASGLGHDARASVYGLDSISDETLRSHLGANFSAGSIVVVGTSTSRLVWTRSAWVARRTHRAVLCLCTSCVVAVSLFVGAGPGCRRGAQAVRRPCGVLHGQRAPGHCDHARSFLHGWLQRAPCGRRDCVHFCGLPRRL
jgi:hypothetical protein